MKTNTTHSISYPKKPIAFFLHYAKQYKFHLLGIFGLTFFAEIFFRLSPYLFSELIDTITAYSGDRSQIWSSVSILLLGLFLAPMIGDLFHKAGFYITILFEPRLKAQIKGEMFEYVNQHSAGYLSDQLSGQLGSRIQTIVMNTKSIFWHWLFGFYDPLLKLIITMAILATVNIIFSGILFFWVVVLMTFLFFITHSTQKYSRDKAEAESHSDGRMIDAIANILTIKSFSNLFFERQILNKLLAVEIEKSQIQMRAVEAHKLLQTTIAVLMEVSLIAFAIYMWSKDQITPGDFVLVITITHGILSSVNGIMYTLLDYNLALGALDDALKIVREPIGIQDKPNAKTLKIKQADIEFEHVDFSYGKRASVFNGLNVKIEPTQKVGLVGASGAGKSTFIQLIQRFYDIQSGSIKIGGQDIREVTQDSLRQAIAVIPQDTSLFHRSLRDNIGYGRIDASDADIIKASKQAHIHDFIKSLPDGYDTLVGERGVKLSGGQRQRIAIARAILKDAPILILDEATSALDSESEKMIQDSLKVLMKGKTVIAIAHRLSTLNAMDRILVFEKGKIIEDGKHTVLIRKSGKYAKLWQMQSQTTE